MLLSWYVLSNREEILGSEKQRENVTKSAFGRLIFCSSNNYLNL